MQRKYFIRYKAGTDYKFLTDTPEDPQSPINLVEEDNLVDTINEDLIDKGIHLDEIMLFGAMDFVATIVREDDTVRLSRITMREPEQ